MASAASSLSPVCVHNAGGFLVFRNSNSGIFCGEDLMAEGEGFEPPVPFQVQRFSRPPVSTTHTSLRICERDWIVFYTRPVWRLLAYWETKAQASSIHSWLRQQSLIAYWMRPNARE